MAREIINRVDQYDALMIDDECKEMLFSQLLKVFDYFPQKYKIRFENELRLILGKFFYVKITLRFFILQANYWIT